MQELQEDRVNEKVDVFSFGVVMWEIWTWAEQPYPGLGLPEIFSVSICVTLLLLAYELKSSFPNLHQRASLTECRDCFTLL